jgi:hypothetical protein
MRVMVAMALLLGGCTATWYNSRASHEERKAELKGQLGDGAGAQRAADLAAGYRETARLHAETHGWLWHDLAAD